VAERVGDARKLADRDLEPLTLAENRDAAADRDADVVTDSPRVAERVGDARTLADRDLEPLTLFVSNDDCEGEIGRPQAYPFPSRVPSE
jgi:hypothetical protein